MSGVVYLHQSQFQTTSLCIFSGLFSSEESLNLFPQFPNMQTWSVFAVLNLVGLKLTFKSKVCIAYGTNILACFMFVLVSSQGSRSVEC